MLMIEWVLSANGSIHKVTAAPVNIVITAPLREVITAPVNKPTIAPVREVITAPVNKPMTAPVTKLFTAPEQFLLHGVKVGSFTTGKRTVSELKRKVSRMLICFKSLQTRQRLAPLLFSGTRLGSTSAVNFQRLILKY